MESEYKTELGACMSRVYCDNCTEKLDEDDVRWAFDLPFCGDCFNDRYCYCERCDELLTTSNAHFSEDYAYCQDCWNEDFDASAPDNPDVDDADRKLIIELSRNWLQGKTTKRCVIKINSNDYLLPKVKEKVGLVETQLYVFGLKDRDDYQISVSNNLIEFVKEHIMLNGLDWKVAEGIGCNRLGLSHKLRSENFRELIKLIKDVARVRVTEPA